MATIIEQQVALDEALIPSTQRLRIGRSNFRLPSVIQSKESTLQLATAYVHQRSIRFKMDNKKHIVELESFREMLHICPRIPGQAFAELPFEEEILEFIRFLGHGAPIRTLTDININKLYQPNTKAYKEYYVCATREASPKPKASAKRKRSGSDTSITPPTATTTPITTVAVTLRLTAAAKGEAAPKPKASVRRTKSSSNTSITPPTVAVRVPDVPTDESEEELSWNSKDDEGDDHEEHDDDGDEEDEGDDGKEGNGDDDEDDDGKEGDDDDANQEVVRDDDKDEDEEGGDDEHESDEETREEESFDPIPQTPKDSEDECDGGEDLSLNIGGRGLQLSQDIEDSHMTLTLVNPDGQEESSSVSSQFVTSMLNPTSDAGMDSIFTTASSPVAPLRTSTPIMTPSTIATTTTISHAPIPPTKIPSEVLQNLLTFDSVFRFEDRLKSLEAKFLEYIQTNPFAEAVSNISGIVHQYMNQQMTEAVRVSVNAQLEAEVLTRSSHSSRTSYAVAADLSEMELKKILIEKMEGNKVDTLTPELLAGPTFKLMKGSCTSLIELEYHLEEVYKVTTDQLDWVNPEGQQYPHNLLQPLPLIPDNRGRCVIPFSHFINNDLEYLRGGASSRRYTTSVTKTKVADYENIKCIEDLVPRSMWIQEPINYDKHALWGVSHWGRKRQQFYGFAVNQESALDVYSKRRIIVVTDLKIVEWHSYKHLDWITVRRDNDKLYKFKEGDFKGLRLQDIEDMLLLLIQVKLSNLTVEERFAFNKRLNLTKPDTYRSDLKRREAYSAYSNPRGFIYQNKDKKNRLMRIDELHKFSDGTLNDVRNALDDHLKGIQM
nr:hypothetical protein [Tanacetum cinerariifolium]